MRLATKETETENLFETLANKSPVGLYIVQDGMFCYINPTFRSNTGYREDELLGRDSLEIVFPEDRERVREKAIKMLKGQLTLPYQFRVTHKNDSIRWIMESVVPIQYHGRQATLGSFVDITERKQAEEALQAEKNKLQSLIDAVEYIITIRDTEYNIIYENEPARIVFSGDHLGEKCYRVYEHREKVCDGCPVDEAFKDGKSHTTEMRLVTPSREVIFLESTANPIRDAEGRIVSCLEVSRNITERKQAEEAIKQAAEEWRETFDSISDAISIHSRDHQILRVNKAFADKFHIEPSQVIGKHCYELHKGKKPRAGCPHQQTLATGKPAAAEFFESHLGKYLLETTSPIFNEKGEVVNTVHITRDITEQKQQNERLMLTNRLASLGELAAGAAHELNNPLTSIIGFSQLLMEKDTPDYIRRDLAFIQSEAKRAANVTSNLLTFARKHVPVKQLNQINNIIEDVLKLRSYWHKSNGIEVERHLDPDLPEIMADYFQMQQVFMNIIINAEYFMIAAHNKGTLTITTEKQNGSVRISFADDGPGISPENLKRIFDPFFTTKEAGKGTGLGLSICHGIVAQHGGQIYARSQPSKGTTIFIELPINGRDHIGGRHETG